MALKGMRGREALCEDLVRSFLSLVRQYGMVFSCREEMSETLRCTVGMSLGLKVVPATQRVGMLSGMLYRGIVTMVPADVLSASVRYRQAMLEACVVSMESARRRSVAWQR